MTYQGKNMPCLTNSASQGPRKTARNPILLGKKITKIRRQKNWNKKKWYFRLVVFKAHFKKNKQNKYSIGPNNQKIGERSKSIKSDMKEEM